MNPGSRFVTQFAGACIVVAIEIASGWAALAPRSQWDDGVFHAVRGASEPTKCNGLDKPNCIEGASCGKQLECRPGVSTPPDPQYYCAGPITTCQLMGCPGGQGNDCCPNGDVNNPGCDRNLP